MKTLNNFLTVKLFAAVLLAANLFFSHAPQAHNIPSRITLQIFVHPQADQLSILMRVPMEAMSEVDFPTRGPGYLNFSELDSALEEAVRVYVSDSFTVFENGIELLDRETLAMSVALPSDRSFTDFESAYEAVTSAPLTDDVDLLWQQADLDVLTTYPIRSADSQFSVDSALSRLGLQTNTVLRFVLPDGDERVFNYSGNPGRIQLDPSLLQSLARFLVMGFLHILEGTDHLLFLFCLIIPLAGIRELIPIVTAFTLAHSITLISSAFGLVPQALWFAPLIEALIALSIVYMAFENILGSSFRHRWMMTYGFGLVHGFGFSFLLADTMQFAGENLITSLLAFNVGVELGQILVLIVVVPAVHFAFRYIRNKKIAKIVLSALVAHSAWHWLMERTTVLSAYDFQWPVMDTVFFITATRWGMLLIVATAILWAMRELVRRFERRASAQNTS